MPIRQHPRWCVRHRTNNGATANQSADAFPKLNKENETKFQTKSTILIATSGPPSAGPQIIRLCALQARSSRLRHRLIGCFGYEKQNGV